VKAQLGIRASIADEKSSLLEPWAFRMRVVNTDDKERPSKLMSPEVHLLTRCVIWPLSAKALAEVDKHSREDGLDWEHFVALTARHRVAAMTKNALGRAQVSTPAAAAERLARSARQEALKELALAGEVLRLNKVLRASGVKPVLLKGVSVALQGFGRLGLRNNRDIDLLVRPTEALVCQTALLETGYRQIEPGPQCTLQDVKKWLILHKDMVFVNPETDSIVELHWRLFDNPRLMPLDDVVDAVIQYGGSEIAVLPKFVNAIYLCAHGSQHAWSRLKWLADLAAQLSHFTDADFHQLDAEARRLGLIRLVGASLRLCVRLLHLSVPPRLLRGYERDWRIGLLEQTALASLLRGGVTELEDRRFGSTLKNLSHYLFRDDPLYWLAEMKYDFLDEPDAPSIGASSALLQRLPRWISRHTRLGGKSPRGSDGSV
jgi:hypothetical protein